MNREKNALSQHYKVAMEGNQKAEALNEEFVSCFNTSVLL